jgi:nucleotide-binding universal stress UspA family protein
MFKNILIAYDGSDHARKAANMAGSLARFLGINSVVWIVTVMNPSPRELGEPFLSQYIEHHTTSGQNLIREATDIISHDVEIRSELLFGNPADCILQVAETRGCDLIIAGTRGLGVLEEILLGSQAQKIINHAHCPVLIVK